MGSKKVWIVGARDTCDIVVDQPTVSGEHCRLEFDDGRVFIEDLQSTNGTFVNGERIYNRKQIHPDALVTLGKSVTLPMPSQLSTPTPPPQRPAPPVKSSTEEDAGTFPLHLLVGSGVAAAVLLLLVVLGIVFWGGDSGRHTTETTDPETAETTDNGNSSTQGETSESAKESDTAKNKLPVGKPEDAIHVIAVANADQSQVFRIGTGVAIGPHTILTSSTVHMVSKLASEKYPQVILLGKTPLTIQNFTPHPTYVSSFQEAEQAKSKFDLIYSRVETSDMQELSDELKTTLEDAYRNYMIIAEKPSHYDVAVIQVAESLPFWLPIAENATLPPRERLTLLGHGYDRLAPFYPPNSPLPVSTETTRVQKTSGVAGDAANARMVIAGFDSSDETTLHLETNWNGSPLLNSQNELVALYSRPTPEITLGSPPTGNTFDATVLVDVLSFVRTFTHQ